MIIKKQSRQKEIKDSESVQNVATVEVSVQPKPQMPSLPTNDDIKNDAFDIDKIDFSQRQERRRGDRRRGYRRIDDRNLISRAQEEAEQIKELAAKEGYKLGLEEAHKDIESLRETISNIISAKKEVFEYIAPDILEISVEIARKIVKKEIEQNPESIIDMILEVMNNISKEETRVVIKVNPMQADLIRSELPEKIAQKGTETKINIIADDSIQEGGCIFSTSNGIIDASIETQTQILKEALKGI